MPDQKCPEELTKVALRASETIDKRGVVDRSVPDIGDLFTASSSGAYELPQIPAVQPVSPKDSLTMPPQALEHFQNWNPSNPAGILSDINIAYFTVANRLYLWDYVERKDVNTYEDAYDIVGVGLAKPKANIFNSEVTHVLIVATVQHINVIPVSFKATGGEYKLTFYKTDILTPASGSHMKSIISTKNGRVFMLSKDGNVWELDYRRDEGWFTSKCSKKLRPPMKSYASFVKTFHDPCIAIATDEKDRVLYQLFESSAIQVTYLGEDGSSYTNIAKCTNLCNSAKLMCPASPLIDSNNFKIISIHPTSAAEAKSYQAVALTSTGCRLYLTHFRMGTTMSENKVPDTLELVHVRTAPPMPQLNAPANQTPASMIPKVVKATYREGLLVLVNEDGEQQTLVCSCPDVGRMANLGPRIGLTEFSNHIPFQGKVIDIVETTTGPVRLNDLTAKHSDPARHIYIFTTLGLLVITKQRPVDMLQRLLTNCGSSMATNSPELENFFKHFGLISSSALCFSIICSARSALADTQGGAPVSVEVAKGATQLLEVVGQAPSSLNSPGQVFTSRHDGLSLFIYRMVSPMWSKKFIEEIKTAPVQYKSVVPRDELISTQQVLRKLQGFMDINVALYPQMDPQTPEEISLKELYELIVLVIEAVSFILYLLETDIVKIVNSLKPEIKARFLSYTYKDLLTTSSGRALSSDLAIALIDDHMTKYNNTDIIADILEQRCGGFCNASNVMLYKGMTQIKEAKTQPNTAQARSAISNSLRLLKGVAGHIPHEKLEEIADDFVSQGALVQAIDLALSCVKARQPHTGSSIYGYDEEPTSDGQSEGFKARKGFYDCIFRLLKETISPSNSLTVGKLTQSQKEQAFHKAFSVEDQEYYVYICGKFIENKMGFALIQLDPPHIEEYLKREPATYERYDLLASYYRMNGRLEDAAYCLETLGNTDLPIALDKRLDYLSQAAFCAKGVTAPSKQFEMLALQRRLENSMEAVKRQGTV